MVTETWVQAGLSPIKRWKCYGGDQLVFAHDSKATGTRMEFAVYVPPQAAKQPWPVLFYLSGLTCTWENATTKAGFQRAAAEHGIVIVAPDTSPRGDDVADDTGYDLGKGAGFYPQRHAGAVVPSISNVRLRRQRADRAGRARSFAVNFARFGITGHSMGGHGALTIAMKNPGPLQVGLGVRADRARPSQVPGARRRSPPIWVPTTRCGPSMIPAP